VKKIISLLILHKKKGLSNKEKKEEKEIQAIPFPFIIIFIKMLYLFVTVYENGKSLIKSAVVGIEEFGNFEDLLKAALYQKELLFEEMLVKIDFQCNDSSV